MPPNNPPAPGTDPLAAIQAQIAAGGLAGAGSTQAPPRGNAIGVPTFQIDPATGQAAIGPDGNPIPWTTQGTVTGVGPRRPGTTDIPAPYQTTATIGARYFEGQEWSEVGGLPPEQRAQIQQAMLDRGLYSSAKPRIAMGAWDNDSATAFKQVLAYANATGQTWDTALRTMPKMDTSASGGVQYGPTAPHHFTAFSATLTNPDDLKAVIKAGARSVLGASLNDDEVNRFVQNYQQSQLAIQQQQYNAQHASEAAGFAAQDAYSHASDEFQQTGQATTPVPTSVQGPSSVTVNPASPGNAAEAFARRLHPAEASAHDLAGTFNNFAQILSQGILGGATTAGSGSG